MKTLSTRKIRSRENGSVHREVYLHHGQVHHDTYPARIGYTDQHIFGYTYFQHDQKGPSCYNNPLK